MMKPALRPQQPLEQTRLILDSHSVRDKVALLGIRAYYRDSMGVVGENDRGIYDDAIILVHPKGQLTFNANTDPTRYRKGKGTKEGEKGMASLNLGLWRYQRGIHRKSYTALVQAAAVTVTRDGDPPYPDTGWFGINIHRGSYTTTSSEGCQTIWPDQWAEFIDRTLSEMRAAEQWVIPYLLIAGPTR